MKLEDLIIILICSIVLFFWFIYVIYFFARRRSEKKKNEELIGTRMNERISIGHRPFYKLKLKKLLKHQKFILIKRDAGWKIYDFNDTEKKD